MDLNTVFQNSSDIILKKKKYYVAGKDVHNPMRNNTIKTITGPKLNLSTHNTYHG